MLIVSNHMLYPKASKEEGALYYVCRLCDHPGVRARPDELTIYKRDLRAQER